MHRQKWFLPGLLVFALILRVIEIQTRGIWYDDAFSIFLSQRSFGQIIQGTAADTMPPLFYFILHFWMKLGMEVWLIRALNIGISLGIVWLTTVWVSMMFGNTAGFWAGFFTAISPLQIYHAQEIRMYPLMTISLLGYVLFFTRLYKKNATLRSDRLDWIGLILCGIAAFYSHNLAGFTLLVPDIFLMFRRRWRNLLSLLIGQGIIALAAIPWAFYLPGQIQKIQNAFWTPRPGILEVLQAALTFVTNLPLPSLLLPAALIITFMVLVMAILETRRNHWKDENLEWLVFLICIPPLLLFLLSYIMRPVFVPRAFMFSSVAYYAWLGRITACSQNKPARWIIVGLFILGAVIALPSQYLFNEFPRSPFQQAGIWLSQNTGNNSLVLHSNKLSFFPMRYYQPSLPEKFLPDEAGSQNDTLATNSQIAMGIYAAKNIQDAVGDTARVQYVVLTEEINEYEQSQSSEPPALKWLQNRYTQNNHQVFGDLEIFSFSK